MIVETPSPQLRNLLTGHERRVENRCWRLNGTPTALLVHTRAGRAFVRDAEGEQVISSGDTVLWAPGATHDFGCREGAEPWEIVWAHFRPREQWRDWRVWPAGAGVVRIPSPTEGLRALIGDALLEMDGHADSALPRAAELAGNALERALLWLDAACPGPQQVDDRIQEAVLFIASRVDRPLTVAAIADAVRLSPSRLSHLFQQELGVPPARYIELRRMGRARALLETTSLPIRAIAQATGFNSQYYFATRFKACLLYTSPSPRD